ncbi:MAG: phage baseplate protein [Alphaproteobacteria bacterium]
MSIVLSFMKNFFNSDTYVIKEITPDGEKPVLISDSMDEFKRSSRSNIAKFPVESGFLASDYKYYEGAKITVKAVISRNNALAIMGFGIGGNFGGGVTSTKKELISNIEKDLKYHVKNATQLNIYGRNGNYNNYSLIQYEINETLENYGLFEVTMDFDEWLEFNSTLKKPKNASDSDTQDAGISNTKVG